MLVCQPDHDLAHAGIGQLPETTYVVSDRPGIENRRGASPVTATRPEPFDQFGHMTVVRADQYRRQVGQLDERRVAVLQPGSGPGARLLCDARCSGRP